MPFLETGNQVFSYYALYVTQRVLVKKKITKKILYTKLVFTGIYMDFLDRLEYLIKKTGLSKKDFAQKCGISRTQLFRYLKGDQEPGTFFYRNLKKNFKFADLGWLIAGISDDGDVEQQKEKKAEKVFYDNIFDKLAKLDRFSKNEINEVDQFIDFRLYSAKRKKK